MDTSTVTDYESILQLVRGWPSDRRLSLVRDVLKTLKPQERPHIAWQDDAFESTQPRRKRTLDKALGLLATDRPAPSDAEVERWLDEHRTEKYG